MITILLFNRRPPEVDGAARWRWLGGGGKQDHRARGPCADLFRDFLQVKAPTLQGRGGGRTVDEKDLLVLINRFSHTPSWCRKKQVLDLEEEGLWPELLDSGRIEICVSDW